MPFSNTIRIPKPGLNKFKLNHERLLTNNMGELTPNLCELVYPGDVWKLSSVSKTYLQSMIGTTMGNFRVYQFYHFVPLRLIWKNYTPFITGGEDGNDATPHPIVNSGTGWKAGSLMDHLGYTSSYYDESNNEVDIPNLDASALPVRAYNQVINDWFINQNIDGMQRDISTDDGLDTTTDTSIFKYVWKPDYFVNALPWAQRGQPISIQLGDTAPVIGTGMTLGMTDGSQLFGTQIRGDSGAASADVYSPASDGYGKNNGVSSSSATTSINNKLVGVTTDPTKSGLQADISNASAITINQLRDAIAMQTFAEVSALTGARYIEYLLGMWGVRSSDKTLQRSQYLGGGVAPVYISEVAQTSSTDSTTPQGNLTSNGIAVNTAWGFKHRFEEFGILLGTFVIMPDAYYFQGLRRFMSYNSRWDYPNPLFSHLGEQEVLEREIYAQGVGNSTTVGDVEVTDETQFGFVPRYDEGRYIPSTIHGDFRTNLKYLHAGRQFANPPMLNADFMQGTPSKRIFAVTTQEYDSCKTEVAFNIKCWRKLPKYGRPTTFGLMSSIGGK